MQHCRRWRVELRIDICGVSFMEEMRLIEILDLQYYQIFTLLDDEGVSLQRFLNNQ